MLTVKLTNDSYINLHLLGSVGLLVASPTADPGV